MKKDYILKDLIPYDITGSFGLTKLKAEDSLDSVITRADNLMYKSKESGKDKISIDKED